MRSSASSAERACLSPPSIDSGFFSFRFPRLINPFGKHASLRKVALQSHLLERVKIYNRVRSSKDPNEVSAAPAQFTSEGQSRYATSVKDNQLAPRCRRATRRSICDASMRANDSPLQPESVELLVHVASRSRQGWKLEIAHVVRPPPSVWCGVPLAALKRRRLPFQTALEGLIPPSMLHGRKAYQQEMRNTMDSPLPGKTARPRNIVLPLNASTRFRAAPREFHERNGLQLVVRVSDSTN